MTRFLEDPNGNKWGKFLCHEVSLLKDYLHAIYLFLTTKTVATVGYLTFTWAEGQKLRKSP